VLFNVNWADNFEIFVFKYRNLIQNLKIFIFQINKKMKCILE